MVKYRVVMNELKEFEAQRRAEEGTWVTFWGTQSDFETAMCVIRNEKARDKITIVYEDQ